MHSRGVIRCTDYVSGNKKKKCTPCDHVNTFKLQTAHWWKRKSNMTLEISAAYSLCTYTQKVYVPLSEAVVMD